MRAKKILRMMSAEDSRVCLTEYEASSRDLLLHVSNTTTEILLRTNDSSSGDV